LIEVVPILPASKASLLSDPLRAALRLILRCSRWQQELSLGVEGNAIGSKTVEATDTNVRREKFGWGGRIRK
jgi:hypothetical protein